MSEVSQVPPPTVEPTEEVESGELSKSAAKKAAKKAEKDARKAASASAQQAPQGKTIEELFKALSIEDIAAAQFGVLPLVQSRTNVPVDAFASLKNLDESAAGTEVRVRCRVHNSRSKGKLCFLVLRDGLYSAQAVLFQSESISKDMVKFASGIPKESIVDVVALVSKPDQPIEKCSQKTIELHVRKLFVVSMSSSNLPIQLEDAMRPESETTAEDGTEFVRVNRDTRLDNRTLDLRVPAHLAIFRIQSMVGNLFREYLCTNDFIEIHSPKMIGGASEGGANVFQINYFGNKAFLAQSPQLYKQMAVMADFKKVFEIGPVFRAENSNTLRHLTEFTGLDIEMEIVNSYSEVLDVLDDMFDFIIRNLNSRCQREMEVIRTQYPFEPFKYTKPALRLKYPEAIKMLKDAGADAPDLEDLSTVNERLLGKLVKDTYDTDFFMLEKFPSCARPFYTMPCPDDSRYSNSYDLFFRGQEICSGAQRIHDPELLISRARDLGVDPQTLSHYIDSFKYGAYPHGGAGIGLERVTMLFLGLQDVRKASLFPRDPQRLMP
eukprot:ANDGO_05954.mRNA.1 Aspartate--tRNA ligase